MSLSNKVIEKQVREYCAQIGTDPLLVQGAGGNVSWKDDGTLWIKASGACLSDALRKNIFIPVDLTHLQQAIADSDFSVTPKVLGISSLKPSIETMLHALIPYKIVLHLHAVEVLAHLVRDKCEKVFAKLIPKKLSWLCVDYYKPGAELAKEVARHISKNTNVNVVFLRNHGLIIGGKDIVEIRRILNQLTSSLCVNGASVLTAKITNSDIDISQLKSCGYTLCQDLELQQLALYQEFLFRLENDWALYPDHVVFLGEKAVIINRFDDLKNLNDLILEKLPFLFVKGVGVFENNKVTSIQLAQLHCYYDVIMRQSEFVKLISLNKAQIKELISWDAEQYRKKLLK